MEQSTNLTGGTARILVSPTESQTLQLKSVENPTTHCSQSLSGAGTSTAVTVHPLPTVNAGTYAQQCVNDTAITLSGTPAGGTFSGTGVTGNSFNPATAGVGTHTITYTYTDGHSCENSATTNIVVNALPATATLSNDATNNTICTGEAVTFTAGGGTEYEFFVNDVSQGAKSATNTFSTSTLNHNDKVKVRVYNASNCSKDSDVITMQVNTITAGVIAADQTILTGATPAPFTSTAAGNSTLGTSSYQWYKKVGAGAWQSIAGANAATYASGALTATTQFKREISSTVKGKTCSLESNVITVTVILMTPGTIGTSQAVCEGSIVALTSITAATGHDSYQWQKKVGAGAWTDIVGANGADYTTEALTVETKFRRVAIKGGKTANSNEVTISINKLAKADLIIVNAEICTGETATLTVKASESGVAYQLQKTDGTVIDTKNGTGVDIHFNVTPPISSSKTPVTLHYKIVATKTYGANNCSVVLDNKPSIIVHPQPKPKLFYKTD